MPQRSTNPEPDSQGGSVWIEWLVASALFVLLFAVYILSPAGGLWDSRFAVLTSESILEGDGFDLARFLDATEWERPSSAERPAAMPWQLERRGARLIYVFPPGTPVLSLPLVAVLRAGGLSTLDADQRYDRASERWMQLLIASFLAALTAAVALRLARHEVALAEAAAIALVTGLGSSLWTVASRELWSQTWSALLIGVAWLELVRWEKRALPRPLLFGAILSAAFWVRPSNAWIALAMTAFVALRHRTQTTRLLISGLLGLAAYCAWSLHYWGAPFPRYVSMTREWSVRAIFQGSGESLFSMQHGLLVYSPILLAVVYVLWRRGVPHSQRPLAGLALAIIAGHLALHAASGARWGIDGPRFQHDLIPILAWLGAVALRRTRDSTATPARHFSGIRRTATVAVLLLAAASVLASIGGVYIGQRRMGQVRSELEASYPAWDLRRLPQYLGLRVLSGADPPRLTRKQRRRLQTAPD